MMDHGVVHQEHIHDQIRVVIHVQYVDQRYYMENQKLVIIVVTQHEHVVHRREHVLIDQLHEVMHIQVVLHDVVQRMDVRQERIEIRVLHILLLNRMIVIMFMLRELRHVKLHDGILRHMRMMIVIITFMVYSLYLELMHRLVINGE
jgi:hypothetical protein